MDLSGDLSKLKVVELKAELAARGLDTKGIKAMLVSRLEAALAAEKSGTSLPITISETTDVGSSHEDEESVQSESVPSQSDASTAVEPSPARPTRRRRTRSMTRSPSPEAKKVMTDSVLAALQEEETEAGNPSSSVKTETAEIKQEPVTKMEVDSVPEVVPAPTASETTPEESQDTPKEQETEGEEGKGSKRSRDDSKSPSRKRSSSVEPHSNDFTNDEDEPAIDDTKFLLSWFDSDLHLKVDQTDFLHAKPISDAGLNLVWAGARANHGVKSGKVAFEVYLSNYNRVNHSQEDRRIHEFRCGWSTGDTSLQLGEAPLSFGFDSNGKKCSDSKFEDYGKRYSLFDVIGVYLDLDSSPCTIEYTINGETQGKAFEFEKESLEGKPLYPHISTKNIGYKVNFGQVLPTLYSSVPPKPKDNRRERNSNRRPNENKNKHDDSNKKESETTKKTEEEMWDDQVENKEPETENNGDQPSSTETTEETSNQETNETVEGQTTTEASKEETTTTTESETKVENAESKPTEEEEKPGNKELLPDYIFIETSPAEALEAGPRRPESRKECEVVLMIGLPGTGKTYYARNLVKEYPEKRYNAFGVQFLLEKMKISGEPRKPSQSYRWSQIVESLSRSLNILLNIACRRRRNYIFDQPNVYANLQRRKMSRFGDFHRKAVIVFPDEETQKERAAKRLEEQGKEYSPINEEEMRSKISLPVLEHTWFNEIVYSELLEDKARELVVKINEDGQAARKKRKEGRDDRSRQRYQKFQDNRREPWRQQRGGPGGWDRRPGEGYGYGRPDRFRDQWGNQNNWVRGGQGYQRQSVGGAGRFDQQRRQDDRRRSQVPDNKRQKSGGDKSNWTSNNWSTYGQGGNFAQGGSGWAQQWPPQGGQGANGNQYGGTWW